MARKIPEEQSVMAFIDALNGHSKIATVQRREGTYLLDVVLESGKELTVFMTNLYVVGEADVHEICSANPDVNCIVTLSSYNDVSEQAVEQGRPRKIGVFTWKEFFGAINYNKFWLYEAMPIGLDTAQETAERRRRKRAWN